MATDVCLIEEQTAIDAFTDEASINAVIAATKSVLDSFEHDMKTPTSRKRTATLSAKVSKLKTRIDGAGKELVSGWKAKSKLVDASRKTLRDSLDELRDEARKPLNEWEAEQERIELEKAAAILAEKDAALLLADHEIGLLLNEKFDDDIAAAVILEAQAAEERKRLEQERMNREATERAERLLVEQREQLDRDKAQALQAEKEAAARAQQAERDKVIAQNNERMAEERRIAAEAQAKTNAEAAAENARLMEVARQAEAARHERAELDRRKANKRHVGGVRRAAKEAIMRYGVDETTAKAIVIAIAKGDIPSVSIAY